MIVRFDYVSKWGNSTHLYDTNEKTQLNHLVGLLERLTTGRDHNYYHWDFYVITPISSDVLLNSLPPTHKGELI